MYITVKSIKRNLGFHGIEIADLIIGIPILFIFIILFCFTNLKLFSLVLLMVGIFLLIPVSVSKKNRMYKISQMLFAYLKNEKEGIYFSKKLSDGKVGKISGIFRRIRNEAGL